MPLHVPSYIANAKVADNVLRYAWDDWNLKPYYGDLSDEDLYDEFSGLSYRAAVALTIACAEWVVHRYAFVSDDPVPLQYIEAAWAAVVDENYLSPWQPPDEDWMGPIRGPLSVALLIIREAIGTAVHEDEQAIPIIYIGNLAEHVLPDASAFLEWRDNILDRLLLLYPLDDEETLGEVVPREAMDPDYPFAVEQTEGLVEQFLTQIDYRTNPLLASPHAMIEAGSETTPYRFDLADDKRKRVNW